MASAPPGVAFRQASTDHHLRLRVTPCTPLPHAAVGPSPSFLAPRFPCCHRATVAQTAAYQRARRPNSPMPVLFIGDTTLAFTGVTQQQHGRAGAAAGKFQAHLVQDKKQVRCNHQACADACGWLLKPASCLHACVRYACLVVPWTMPCKCLPTCVLCVRGCRVLMHTQLLSLLASEVWCMLQSPCTPAVVSWSLASGMAPQRLPGDLWLCSSVRVCCSTAVPGSLQHSTRGSAGT